jgi:hypothetical protein
MTSELCNLCPNQYYYFPEAIKSGLYMIAGILAFVFGIACVEVGCGMMKDDWNFGIASIVLGFLLINGFVRSIIHATALIVG